MTTRIFVVTISSIKPEPDTAWYNWGPGTEKAPGHRTECRVPYRKQ